MRSIDFASLAGGADWAAAVRGGMTIMDASSVIPSEARDLLTRSGGPIRVSRSLASLGMTLLASMIVMPPRTAAAQSAPPAKLAKSIERIYGPGVRVDTVHVDSAEVYRASRGGAL